MKKLLFLFCFCSLLTFSEVQAQRPISVGLTSGWGAGWLHLEPGPGTSSLRTEPFLVIPIGVQARLPLRGPWSLHLGATYYSSRYGVNPGRLWFGDLLVHMDNSRGSLEVGLARRKRLKASSWFWSVEAGMALQSRAPGSGGCMGGGVDADSLDRFTVFRTKGLGERVNPALQLRLSLEREVQWGKRPVSLVAGLYLNQGLGAFWEGLAQSREGEAVGIEMLLPVGASRRVAAFSPPLWHCHGEATRGLEHTVAWRDFGSSAGLHFALLFPLRSSSKHP
ncbi:MAG: hypothetical protein AAFR61_10010 [Bacteroidota bacterium]